MKSRKQKIDYIVTAAVIAAFYAGLTFISGFFGLAYGPVQFRLSEVLTILPVFTPAAIPGLAVGCFLANIMSYNPIDMLFGTAATVIAAVVTYLLRNVRFKKIPLLSLLSPIFFNSIIVGFEIAMFFSEDIEAKYTNFFVSAGFVGLGEAVICLGLGIPFFVAVDRYLSRNN